MREASPQTAATGAGAGRRVLVWDLPVRVFHWLLAVLVTFSLTSGFFAAALGTELMQWHPRSGYCILTLVLFRLAWGWIGSQHARFTNFVRAPAAVIDYLRQGSKSARSYLGHNPLGGWSVIAMLISLLTQALTGLFLADEDLAVEGPLNKHVSNATSDFLASVHEINGYLLLGLIALHLTAIVFYLVARGENLIAPMISGFKWVAAAQGQDAESKAGLRRAVVVLLIVAAVVFYTVT